jgi:hypothetical protein
MASKQAKQQTTCFTSDDSPMRSCCTAPALRFFKLGHTQTRVDLRVAPLLFVVYLIGPNRGLAVVFNTWLINNNSSSSGPTSPGVARDSFFVLFAIIQVITLNLTLRFRLRYVTVAGVRRIAATFWTLAVTSQSRSHFFLSRGGFPQGACNFESKIA